MDNKIKIYLKEFIISINDIDIKNKLLVELNNLKNNETSYINLINEILKLRIGDNKKAQEIYNYIYQSFNSIQDDQYMDAYY